LWASKSYLPAKLNAFFERAADIALPYTQGITATAALHRSNLCEKFVLLSI